MHKEINDNETFITLIRIAQEDPKTHRQLSDILSLKQERRKVALQSCIDMMKIKHMPSDFIEAIAYLLDEKVTEKTIDIIREELGSPPHPLETLRQHLLFAIKLIIAIPATGATFLYATFFIVAFLELTDLSSKSVLTDVLPGIMAFTGGCIGGVIIVNQSWKLIGALAGIAITGLAIIVLFL